MTRPSVCSASSSRIGSIIVRYVGIIIVEEWDLLPQPLFNFELAAAESLI